ncbi:MAG: hypothetical protein JWO19_4039 [Bryobacterales bacterium]|nr:hypothetical protein [Bryobacterales bacterium]
MFTYPYVDACWPWRPLKVRPPLVIQPFRRYTRSVYMLDNAQTKGRPRALATEGDWWRFSLYEIRDGCIRPADGAKLEWYSPWPGFELSRTQTVGQTPAATQPNYQSLMKLVHQLEYLPGETRYPDCLSQKSQGLILDWCQRNGLLGVLLSRWEAISLAPRHDHAARCVQRRYFRGFGQVIQVQEITIASEDRNATVLIHGLDDLTPAEEAPSKTWARFFPSVGFSERDTFAYPQPYTVEFCQLYGERLIDFCNAARLLVGAILHLGRKPPKITGDPKLARHQALDTINLLRRPVASALDFAENGSVKPSRVAPSLLASFADMFAQDLIYGRPTLQCTCCGTPFVSSAYQARYCSKTCRLREQKQRLRAQMKRAKAFRAQGQSLRQIAASVGQPLARVKRWLRSAKG